MIHLTLIQPYNLGHYFSLSFAEEVSENYKIEVSLAVQWLRLHTSTAGGTGLIPGQGTEIQTAMQHDQK